MYKWTSYIEGIRRYMHRVLSIYRLTDKKKVEIN